MGKFDWKNLVKGAAPLLGAAIGGPFGPIATSLIGAVLGDDKMDETTIATKLQNADPETVLKLKQAEYEFKQYMRDADLKELDILSESDRQQNAINLENAKSPSKFKSWGRPAAIWVCVAGLAYQFLFRTIVGWTVELIAWANIESAETMKTFPDPPSLDTGTLLTLLFGLLGLGAYRTVEKWKGVDRSR